MLQGGGLGKRGDGVVLPVSEQLKGQHNRRGLAGGRGDTADAANDSRPRNAPTVAPTVAARPESSDTVQERGKPSVPPDPPCHHH